MKKRWKGLPLALACALLLAVLVFALSNRPAEPAAQDPPETAAAAEGRQGPEAIPAGLTYDANGGHLIGDETAFTATQPISATHLRTNTLQGTRCFVRPGYLQIAWNTRADGTGESIGLGSRYAAEPGDILYARWLPVTPEEAFDWESAGGQVRITGYHGTEDCCVIPLTLDGMPVRTIASGAFRDVGARTVVLSWNLRKVEDGAFTGCAVETLYLYDSLTRIGDGCFAGCDSLRTLHVNAVTSPRYSTSYYASFADKYDRLLALRGQKKLVLFSGSSTRYAYDCAMFREAFPAWEPANMGVYAYTNALPQLDLILRHMEPGDTLLHAPEFDTLRTQFCEETALDFHFWAMAEADYDCAGELSLQDYEGVFDSLASYFSIREFLPVLDYEDSPNGYDDDGGRHPAPTYNMYGDFVLRREGGTEEKLLQVTRAPYTPDAFPPGRLEALNRVYRRFQDRGIRVLFTFTPRNRCSLTEESTPERRAALDRLMRDDLCVPVILSVEGSLLPTGYFWLIDSHLSTEGAALYTERMIQALAPWLNGS